MKTRYKVLIVSLSFLALLVASIILLGFCFHRVEYNEYALAYNTVFNTMTDTQPRTHGNYFLGLDMILMRFPRGLVKYDVDRMCNTVDKSPVRIKATMLGRLVPSGIVQLYYAYGVEYQEVVRRMVQEFLAQAVENFSIVELVGNRTDIENLIAGTVKTKLEGAFPYIYVDHFSLGELGTELYNPAVFT